MNRGKVKEAILQRTIFKKITYRNQETVSSSGIGSDAAVLENQGEVTVISTNPVTYTFKGMEKLAIASAMNNVVAKGGCPKSVLVSILLPERYKETALKKMMESLNLFCKEYGIDIVGGHTEVTTAVNTPVINVTAVGYALRKNVVTRKRPDADMDIVMTKYIGIPATMIIQDIKREELRKKFSENFIDRVNGFDKYYSIIDEGKLASSHGVICMHDVSRGGIFQALWEMAEYLGFGFEVDVDRILVKQETIEFCEIFNLNPYEILSTGVLLMVTEDGEQLADTLMEAGIPASVIGRTNSGNDRLIIRNDERGFITPPRGDEIDKIV